MLRRFAMFLAAMGLLLAVPVPYSAQNVGPTLGLEGDHFTVDGVPRVLMSVSYFDAMHANSGTWATDLDYLKALVDPNVPNRPVVGVRVLANWPTNYCTSGPAAQDTLIKYDGTLNGNTLTTLRNFLTAASARGVVVDVTLTRDTVPDASGSSNPMMPFPAYKAGVTAVAAALTAYRNVLFDLQNEYDLGDRLTPPQVQELIQAVHGVDSARIVSASQGGGGSAGTIAAQYGFDFVAYHDDRTQGAWYTESFIADQIDAIRAGLRPLVKPIHFQEPMPWGPAPGCNNTQQDPTPGHARDSARFAKTHGAAGWTFHTRLSFKLAGTSLLARLNADPLQKAELEAIRPTLDGVCWGAKAVSLTPKEVTVNSTGGTGPVSVSVNGSCQPAWTVTSDAGWLTASPNSGVGPGTVTYAAAQNTQPQPRVGRLTIGGAKLTVTQAGPRVINDFDGDGYADLTIWRKSNGGWYRALSSNGYAHPGQVSQWGLPDDIPAPGDYDGDGKADLAIWRPSEGNWYILYSSTNNTSGPPPHQWGLSGDIPVPADYDKDGKTDLAIWRPSGVSEGTWFIKVSSTNFATSQTTQWGLNGDRPVPGDYDGDGQVDLAVWRPSNGTWYILRSAWGATTIQWGLSADVPVPADYDGDGRFDVAVWRPSDGTWYILKSALGPTTIQWGLSSDVPVPGDYDGDGKADLVIWRPAEGNWYIRHSSTNTQHTVQWGLPPDTPLPGNGQPVTVR